MECISSTEMGAVSGETDPADDQFDQFGHRQLSKFARADEFHLWND